MGDLLDVLLSKDPFKPIAKVISHNGTDSLYSTVPIPLEDNKEKKVRFEFSKDDYGGIVPNSILKGKPIGRGATAGGSAYVVYCTVEFVKLLNMNDLAKYTRLQGNTDDPSPYVVALNVSLGYQIAKTRNVFTAGRNRFFFVDAPQKCQSFQRGLYIASGYFASITPVFDNVLVSIRPVAGAFVKSHNKDGSPMTVADLVADYFGETNLATIDNGHIIQQKNFFKNIRIKREYLGHKSKPKAIFDISREYTAANYKFEVDGKNTTVAKYFKDRYKLNVKYPNLPLIHLGGTAYLPMEACHIVPGQEFRGEIHDVRGMLTFTTHRPHVIAGLTQKVGITKISSVAEETRIGTKLMVVPSRVLKAPTIVYKNKKITYVDKQADGRSEKKKGSWDIVGTQFYKAVPGVINLVVCFLAKRPYGDGDKSIGNQAVKEFILETARHGMLKDM
ncbi:unnamed protein product [Ambrosiozyma monospora]|uniref:Unnamed protein product n=1 Tax=Ambrosiozyma monospora TaxID=43982 RepID=A0A9W7DPA1_AMBMO|nr:unnamed protein product [Ambrosiozyma monospora]